MKPIVLLLALLATALAGCSAPKAPGWPSGEARPINATLPNAGSTDATHGKKQ
jgi:hypothetical protein